jgi:hypothetical protein
MVFPSKNDDKIKITVNGIEFCKVTECKYLGVTLDHELKWAAHIEQLYKKEQILHPSYYHGKLCKLQQVF